MERKGEENGYRLPTNFGLKVALLYIHGMSQWPCLWSLSCVTRITGFYDNALYKSTLHLLTYFLTLTQTGLCGLVQIWSNTFCKSCQTHDSWKYVLFITAIWATLNHDITERVHIETVERVTQTLLWPYTIKHIALHARAAPRFWRWGDNFFWPPHLLPTWGTWNRTTPCWRSLQRSPEPLARFKGPYF